MSKEGNRKDLSLAVKQDQDLNAVIKGCNQYQILEVD